MEVVPQYVTIFRRSMLMINHDKASKFGVIFRQIHSSEPIIVGIYQPQLGFACKNWIYLSFLKANE
jgi:hypothetical protein